jgi:hypothetical protein
LRWGCMGQECRKCRVQHLRRTLGTDTFFAVRQALQNSKWVHSKRAIVELTRMHGAQEAVDRVCAYHGCPLNRTAPVAS